MNKSYVVNAVPSDMERTMAALVTAFTADPFIRWLLPEPRKYLVCFPVVLKFFAGGAFKYSSAYRTKDFNAAALWLPPGVRFDEESLGQIIQEVVAPALHAEVFAVLEQVGASHPETEHWHLPAMGVDPLYQGKGYGSALIERGLERCDHNHVAAYLESTNPMNIPFYQRFGYDVVGEIQVGSSPVITLMFRLAR